jgi:hypothetical protein
VNILQMQMSQRQEQRQHTALRQLLTALWWESVVPTEVGLTLLAAIWSAGLLVNDNLFTLSQSYTAMAGIMPERGWAVFCAIVAAVPLVALLGRSYILRLASLVLHVVLWTFVAAMFFLATPFGLGGPIYLTIFAGGAAWVAIRVADEYREDVIAAWVGTVSHWRERWRGVREGRWGRKR